MGLHHAAITEEMQLQDFEEQFFPTSTRTFANESLHPSTNLAKHLKSLLIRDDLCYVPRWTLEKRVSVSLLAGIKVHDLAPGYCGRIKLLWNNASKLSDTAALVLLYKERDASKCDTYNDRTWSRVRTFIHIASGSTRTDPFNDEDTADDSDDPWKAGRETARAQILSAASSMFGFGYRHFFYMIYINDNQLRAVRVDHAGVIISKPVDYVEDFNVLPRLLWHFSQLNDAQQGLDPTATLLEPFSADYKLMEKLGEDDYTLDIDHTEGTTPTPLTPRRVYELRPCPPSTSGKTIPSATPRSRAPQGSVDPRVFEYVRRAFEKSISAKWPRYRLKVGEEGREFLVAQPAVRTNESPFGRDCRAYIAVDRATRQLVWLKDSWRPSVECSRPEGVILQAFANDPKLYVPTLVCHGYVRQQAVAQDPPASRAAPQSAAQATSKKTGSIHAGSKRAREDDVEGDQVQPGAKKRSRFGVNPLPAYRHYRLVVKEVCLELDQFTSGWQLHICAKAIPRKLAHSRAYKHYGLLHGDISPWNILICPTITKKDDKEIVVWRGMLIDWELSTFAHGKKPINPSGDGEPIMSWEFASVQRINHPSCPNTVEDELEAFFYVLVWNAVRYLSHSLPEVLVAPFLAYCFDTFFRYPDDTVAPTSCKADIIRDAQLRYANREITFSHDDHGRPHPLNDLVFELLQRFQARYAMIKQERPTGEERGPAGGEHAMPGVPAEGRAVLRETQTLATSPGQPTQPVRRTKARTVKTRELARSLQSHADVVQLFAASAMRKDWPMNDKGVDQLAGTDYENKRKFIDVGEDGAPLVEDA
ncbi:hypothetical protein C2E23DRAFT_884903 [Lenzites betulinus]|nr:hypothetical protein C2E23DRAFT_884903 [Lenzites betulinus]